MKIYTKTGDKGQTSLMGGDPLPKDDSRIVAYGTIDELNAALGVVISQLDDEGLKEVVLQIQKELFILGAELATVNPSESMQKGFVNPTHITSQESQIDGWEAELEPLKKFILPGGSPAAAQLHLARTLCRRAERYLVHLNAQEPLRGEVIQYINRLSDWLFVLARIVNSRSDVSDILWEGLSLK